MEYIFFKNYSWQKKNSENIPIMCQRRKDEQVISALFS